MPENIRRAFPRAELQPPLFLPRRTLFRSSRAGPRPLRLRPAAPGAGTPLPAMRRDGPPEIACTGPVPRRHWTESGESVAAPRPLYRMRLGAVFIAVCMVVIAASAGATVYLGFGFSGTEAIIVALAVLTAWALQHVLDPARRARRGRQPAQRSVAQQFRAGAPGERDQPPALRASKAGWKARSSAPAPPIDPLAVEISELGTLVRQLAETVATYEARFGEARRSPTAARVAPADRRSRCPHHPRRQPPEPAPPVVEPLPTLVEDIVRPCRRRRSRRPRPFPPPSRSRNPSRRSLPRSQPPTPPTRNGWR